MDHHAHVDADRRARSQDRPQDRRGDRRGDRRLGASGLALTGLLLGPALALAAAPNAPAQIPGAATTTVAAPAATPSDKGKAGKKAKRHAQPKRRAGEASRAASAGRMAPIYPLAYPLAPATAYGVAPAGSAYPPAPSPLAGPTPLAAADKPWGQINKNFRFSGDLRARYESWDFFRPGPARNNVNSYDFGAVRGRLAAEYTTSLFDAYVQGEYINLLDLPNHSTATSIPAGGPGGPLGLGALYFSENGSKSRSPADVHLKQGYLRLKFDDWGAPGAALKGGRFTMNEGLEYQSGDAKFDQLKATRVSQRLLGDFDYSHGGRNFDGGHGVFDQKTYNLTVAGGHPTEGGFNLRSGNEIHNIDIVYAALTSKKDAWLPGEARLFFLNYEDNRMVQVLDNRAAALRPFLNRNDIDIHNLGGHWLTTQKAGPGEIDAMFWGVYQFGTWTTQQQRSWAVTGEAGYQLPTVPWKPWIRGGYFVGSGDGNAKDNVHKTFFEVLPTVRLYAKFPFFNQMNLTDGFAQFLLAPVDSIRIGVDYHNLSLSSANDLFYAGAGATSGSGSFGYLGRASSGKTDVGNLVDLSITYKYSKNFSTSMYYGHVYAGAVLKSFYKQQSDADYTFVETNMSF
jgi:hypothetical protein